MWFVAMVAYLHGIEQPKLALSMAAPRYVSQDACLTDAIRRTDALALVGIHGRYMCMRHAEPSRQLAAAKKREF
jgi:hypothetical protein